MSSTSQLRLVQNRSYFHMGHIKVLYQHFIFIIEIKQKFTAQKTGWHMFKVEKLECDLWSDICASSLLPLLSFLKYKM